MALIDFFLLKLFYLEERSQGHANISVYFLIQKILNHVEKQLF